MKDISPRVGPARDQGRRKTCVAFALSDLHATVKSHVFTPLSVEYLFYQACRLATPFNPHSGVTLDQALEALKNEGQPDEVQWPYMAQLPVDIKDYYPPIIASAIYRRDNQR